ncbi:hypothetical protein IFM47457_08909 [Aspergillus lentulus]|nr:hypothetical protein IFM47457_08909 [Aspergillus lentulus]
MEWSGNNYGVGLTICNNLAFDNFTGLHQGSVKGPDHFLRADTDPEPRIVVESSWSEPFPHLQNDKNLRIRGNASVILVILLKCSALSYSRIKGTAEIWRRDTTGNLFSTTMAIFPAPAPLPQNELNTTQERGVIRTSAVTRSSIRYCTSPGYC